MECVRKSKDKCQSCARRSVPKTSWDACDASTGRRRSPMGSNEQKIKTFPLRPAICTCTDVPFAAAISAHSLFHKLVDSSKPARLPGQLLGRAQALKSRRSSGPKLERTANSQLLAETDVAACEAEKKPKLERRDRRHF